MSVSFGGDTGFFCDVCKERMTEASIPVISIQSSGTRKASIFNDRSEYGRVITFYNLVHCEVNIKVAIIVIIKKSSHGCMRSIIQAIFSGHFFENRNTI